MSDNIKDLPIDTYSNPTSKEITIMNNLFENNNTFDFKHIKLTIILCFIHIIFNLVQFKYKFKLQYFIIITTIILSLSIFLSINYII